MQITCTRTVAVVPASSPLHANSSFTEAKVWMTAFWMSSHQLENAALFCSEGGFPDGILSSKVYKKRWYQYTRFQEVLDHGSCWEEEVLHKWFKRVASYKLQSMQSSTKKWARGRNTKSTKPRIGLAVKKWKILCIPRQPIVFENKILQVSLIRLAFIVKSKSRHWKATKHYKTSKCEILFWGEIS